MLVLPSHCDLASCEAFAVNIACAVFNRVYYWGWGVCYGNAVYTTQLVLKLIQCPRLREEPLVCLLGVCNVFTNYISTLCLSVLMLTMPSFPLLSGSD
jgi:hypothetical protein